jgi:hypothetical protein
MSDSNYIKDGNSWLNIAEVLLYEEFYRDLSLRYSVEAFRGKRFAQQEWIEYLKNKTEENEG